MWEVLNTGLTFQDHNKADKCSTVRSFQNNITDYWSLLHQMYCCDQYNCTIFLLKCETIKMQAIWISPSLFLQHFQVTLNIYSYENCAFHILHRRVPAYTSRTLTSWYNHRTHLHRWRVIQHYTERVTGQLAMLDQLDIIGKTSEFARVFGIEFFDVLSRGTQVGTRLMLLESALVILLPFLYPPVVKCVLSWLPLTPCYTSHLSCLVDAACSQFKQWQISCCAFSPLDLKLQA